MRLHRYCPILYFLCSLCFAQLSYAQNTEKNNLWVMWERSDSTEENTQFCSHLLLNVHPK